MITNTKRAYFDALRTLAAGGISAAYAAVGTPSAFPIRGFCITNDTQGDLIFSDDPNVAAGKWFIAQGSYKLWDVQANQNAKKDDAFEMTVGTQFYVKQVTAPTSGDVYIEILH